MPQYSNPKSFVRTKNPELSNKLGIYELRITNYELRITNYELRITWSIHQNQVQRI
jgi:hypothetical protein